MRILKSAQLAALGAAATMMVAPGALAAGFALNENSAIGVGESHAGDVSGNYDLSTIYNNPAGMTDFTGFQIGGSASLIAPSGMLSNVQGRTIYGAPISDSERDPTETKLIPSGFMLWAPTENVRAGVSLTVPFGLQTSYASSSAVRYQALNSSVTAVDLNPSLAYKLADWVSIGGGFTIEKVKAKLTNALDLGGIVGAQLDARLGAIFYGPLLSQSADGRSDVVGTSYGVGYDFGIQLKPWGEGTRIGITYRSDIDQRVTGRANFAVPAAYAANFAAAGQLQSTGAAANLTLPGSVAVGITHQLTPAIALDATYKWTHWSVFKTLEVDFTNPLQAPSITQENYKDASFMALGANDKLTDRLTLRIGAAYDQTPVQDASRNYRLPDANRYWVSGGASYKLLDGVELSAGYAHLFFDKATVSQTDVSALYDKVSAQANIAADIFSVSATMKF